MDYLSIRLPGRFTVKSAGARTEHVATVYLSDAEVFEGFKPDTIRLVYVYEDALLEWLLYYLELSGMKVLKSGALGKDRLYERINVGEIPYRIDPGTPLGELVTQYGPPHIGAEGTGETQGAD